MSRSTRKQRKHKQKKRAEHKQAPEEHGQVVTDGIRAKYDSRVAQERRDEQRYDHRTERDRRVPGTPAA